jgi:hypothetical protein
VEIHGRNFARLSGISAGPVVSPIVLPPASPYRKWAVVFLIPGLGSLANHPLATRLQNAGITSTAWSYGLAGAYCYNIWRVNGIVGLSQVGKTLTIASFTVGNTDKSLPVEQITYTLSPQ